MTVTPHPVRAWLSDMDGLPVHEEKSTVMVGVPGELLRLPGGVPGELLRLPGGVEVQVRPERRGGADGLR
jgi:hypothetical protein